MERPRVSIIIPTHDRLELLAQTLESVAALEYRHFECIVVDDGSTDGTSEHVRTRCEREPWLRLVCQQSSSAAAARNRGLALARGEFVVFLDSDDLVPPDRLAWQVAELARDPLAVLVYGETFQFVDGDPERGSLYMQDVPDKPQGWAFDALLQCSSIYSPMVRTSAARALGGFDTSLPSAEDWDMWLSLSRVGKVIFQPRVTLRYRVHAGNKSGHVLRNFDCARRVAAKHMVHVAPAARRSVRTGVRRYFRRVYAQPLLRQAWEATRAGDWLTARASWRALLRLHPRTSVGSRSAIAHTVWSLLPTRRMPPWSA